MQTLSFRAPGAAAVACILAAAALPAVGQSAAAPQDVGPIRYETQSVERRMPGCADPCVSLSFTWPEVSAASPAAGAAINETIRAWLGRGVFEDNGGDPDSIWEAFSRARRDFQQEYPEVAYPWWVNRSVTVERNDPAVFAVSIAEDMYTGGAHGIHFRGYVNWDPATGAELRLEDIVLGDGLDELTRLAEQQFRSDKQLAPETPLAEAGFWFENDTFALPGNFLIGEDDLLFHYNEYEIAAYALGPTELRISYDLINELLRARFR